MKKIFFLWSLLATQMIFGQTGTMKNFIPVSGYPAELLPKNAKEIGFIFSDTTDYSAFGYPPTKGKFKILCNTSDELSGMYLMPDLSIYYENGLIVFYTRAPWKATIFLSYYKWDGKKLLLQKTESSDASWDEITLAEEAIEKGNLWEASNHYNSVQYPTSYLDEPEIATMLFSKANQWGLRESKLKNYTAAVSYVQGALSYYYWWFISLNANESTQDEKTYLQTLEDNRLVDYQDSISKWLGNYGYFLYKADSLDKSIEVNTMINKIYPKLSGPYLQLGDSYYDKGKFPEAKAAYLQYIVAMQERNKESGIPDRVHERVK